jgi:hypothetical protein
MLTVFTLSFADEANTNAQNLTAKEVINRLPSDSSELWFLARGASYARKKWAAVIGKTMVAGVGLELGTLGWVIEGF